MAQVTKKTKKDGTTSYLIRAYSGRTQTGKVITKCKTVTPPAGLTARKTERWVQEQADQFEREVPQRSVAGLRNAAGWPD